MRWGGGEHDTRDGTDGQCWDGTGRGRYAFPYDTACLPGDGKRVPALLDSAQQPAAIEALSSLANACRS